MAGVRVVLTYRDYAALPDDGRRHEIHEGELSVTPAPNPRHQDIVLNVATVLRAHVAEHGLGKVFVAPVDVILSDTTIVQPDVVYVATDRLALISGRGIEGAPTLVLEVLSPATASNDRHTKMQLYARHGVPWYWIVDPDARTLDAYALRGAVYDLTAPASGGDSLCAEPFSELTISPLTLWG
jgi:Uma2 family endonuclease